LTDPEEKVVREISHQIYHKIKDKILDLELKFGARVNIESLCKEFHVSSTPIREAIKKLIEDGLIRYIPRKGYYVYSPTPKDIREIYELRTMLERYTLSSISNAKIDFSPFKKLKEKIRNIQKQNDRERRKRFIETEAIHTLIINTIDNQRIKDIYRNLHNYTLLFQHIIQQDSIDGYLEDHLCLTEAILSKNIDAAKRMVDKHNSTAANDLCKLTSVFNTGQNE